MKQFVRLAGEAGYPVRGFLAKGSFSGGKRDRYRLEDASTGRCCEMARREFVVGWIPFRSYWFNPDAFRFGMEILRDAMDLGSGLVVLDEVGPLELEGKGWAAILPELARNKGITAIWVVRESLAETIRKQWKVPRERVFRIPDQQPEELLDQIRLDQGR